MLPADKEKEGNEDFSRMRGKRGGMSWTKRTYAHPVLPSFASGN